MTSPARDHLALALDIDDLIEARRLARELQPWFGIAKVGLELFSAAGPDAVGVMRDLGYRVFLDVKLHDIPSTVARAARVLGALGVDYLTLHASGGPAMLRAGVLGLAEGADAVGLTTPVALAVTVLTSDVLDEGGVLPTRVLAAVEAGCTGMVCSALDVHEAKQYAPRLLAVVPGIRPTGVASHDQARAATPGAAIAAGADVLVIGRAVTQADDRAAAAEAIAGEVTAAMAR
ncbi:MAG TPA: orotidine-5'-phosphate decarboxylase [Acidimicrobiales bacterium]